MKRCFVFLMCLVFACGWVAADTKPLPAKKQNAAKTKFVQENKGKEQVFVRPVNSQEPSRTEGISLPPDVRKSAPTSRIEELRQRIDELKEQGLYDADLWNEYFGTTAPRLHPGNRLDVGGESCETAVVIPSLPFTDTGNTCGGTDECSNPSPDVFYKYTVTSEQLLTISLCGSSYDTYLRVWDGCCVDEIFYNDDKDAEDCVLQSEIMYCFQPGVIWIQVEGYYEDCGDYVLNITSEDCPPPADNGTCATATVIPSLPYTTTGNTYGGGDNCDYEGFEDVFYKFTAPSPNEIIAIRVTGPGACLHIWSECCVTYYQQYVWDYFFDCFPAGDIWIEVESVIGCAPFTLEVTSAGPCSGPPDNGTCETATVIPSLPYSDLNTTCGGGDECGYPGEDVFYKYTVPSPNEVLSIDLSGSHSYFSIFSDCCVTLIADHEYRFIDCFPAGDIWIMVEATTECDPFTIEVTSLGPCPPPPDNGTCETATVISSLPYSDFGTTCGGGNTCGNPDREDVFYKYTAPESGEYLEIYFDDLYGYISVWSVCCENWLALNESYWVGQCFAGDIWIMVETEEDCGLYDLNVISYGDCPECWDMTMDAPGVITGNTCGARNDCDLTGAEDVIVKVSIPHDGDWSFLLEGPDYIPVIGVGTDCCRWNLCEDCQNGPGNSALCPHVSLTAGDYYVMVEGYSYNYCGNFVLTIEEWFPPEPCPCEGDLFASGALNLSIPSVDVPNPCVVDTGVTHTITIPPASGFVTDVNVDVNITCEIGDYLWIDVSHNGVTVLLKGFMGSECSDITTTFDDEGDPWDDGNYACPHIGCFQTYDGFNCGGNLLSAFDGLPVEGDWTIRVVEAFTESGFTLDDWGLCITSEDTGCVPDPQAVEFNPADGLPQCSCLFVCPEDSTIISVGPGLGPTEQPVMNFTSGCMTDGCNNPNCTPIDYVLVLWIYSAPSGIWHTYIKAAPGTAGGCVCACLEDYLAVELVDFDAVPGDRSVTLNWTTASETDNDYFEILRDEQITGRIEGTNSSSGSNYSWTDENLNNGQIYTYTLFAVDINGNRLELGTAEAAPSFSEAVITEYALHQNYPNPFNPVTSISFDLLESGFVSLKVYNLLGQQVAALVNRTMTSGRHIVNFNADALPSGVYLYRLEAGDFTAQKKMILMK